MGGPIGLVKDGDTIRFDLLEGTVTVEISDTEMESRSAQHQSQVPKHARNYLADFANTVAQASDGCVSRSLLDD